MVGAKSVSVFIPVYNCGDVIKRNIPKVLRKMQSMNRDFEIIIVDDTSKDNTQAVAKSFAKHKKIHFIQYHNGPSRRENLADAFRKSKKDIVMFMDADLSTPLQFVDDLLAAIDTGNDVAIGSRYKGIKADRSFSRYGISVLYNNALKMYLRSKIKDHNCGFKAFERGKLLVLLDDLGYDTSFTRGWFWDAELLIRAQRRGYSISEIAVSWKSEKQSTFRIKRELKMIPYIISLPFRLFFSYRKGTYTKREVTY